ncbi:MAG: hypothetical protein ACI3W6_04200 [Clostridia bacterium]
MMDFEALEAPENVKLLNLIPEDVLNKVPEDKEKEFKRSVILYFYRERTELLREIDAHFEVPHDLAEKAEKEIRRFAEQIRDRKA